MKTWLIAGVGMLLVVGGAAVAQTPPGMSPGGAAGAPTGAMEGPSGVGGPEGMNHGPMGRWMGMMHGHHGPHQPPVSKAAFFRLRKGDVSVGIKCADDEPTKACVDAAATLLDKLAQVK